MSKVFVDTNVLAYRFDSGERTKQALAAAALDRADHEFVVSTQVMLELYVVLTRKLQPPLPAEAAEDVLAALAHLPVVGADAALVQRAAASARQHQLSIWDAMIIEAAWDVGCDEVWTEDLHAGASLRDVRIVNPFV